MSGGPRRNVADAEGRPVLQPAGNTTPPRSAATKHQASKLSPLSKHKPSVPGNGNVSPKVCAAPKTGARGRGHVNGRGRCESPRSQEGRSPKFSNRADILRNKVGGSLNLSSCSCSSADSFCTPKKSRKPILMLSGSEQDGRVVPDDIALSPLPQPPPPPPLQNRCPWITQHSDPAYVAFHDNEWGVPEHDDKRLFELLVLSGALAELSWSAILSARDTYRQVFAGFDPAVVASFDEEKIASVSYTKNVVLHEGKLHGIVNNAKLVLKIVEEFGALDTYIWSFVGYKPTVNRYRYRRQVPVRTPKAEVISRDLLKRGFRFVGPTVVYSFMQVAGMTNDHLTHCFRWKECILLSEGLQAGQYNKVHAEEVGGKEREGILCKASEKESITNSLQDFQY